MTLDERLALLPPTAIQTSAVFQREHLEDYLKLTEEPRF